MRTEKNNPTKGTTGGHNGAGPPSRLLDLLPVRLLREAFRAYPGQFTGLSEPALRRRARRELRIAAARYDGSDFARACLDAARADGQAGRARPHAWIREVLDVAATALEDHPFCAANWAVRRDAMALLDYPLHVWGGTIWRRAIGGFYQRFMTRALEQIAAPVTGGELRVWKMYNMGFVVKTADCCVAFDIHPGARMRPPLSGRQLADLAGLVDVVVVSHPHWDHQHRGFIRRMLRAGKTVLLPGRRRPGGDPPNVFRSRHALDEPVRVGPLRLRGYRGWQRFFVRNHVHLLEIGGYRVVHTGDNTRMYAYEGLADAPRPDLALVNCWAGYRTLVQRIRPRLVVTGHENELGHMVSMRCDYDFTFRDLERLHLAPPNGAPDQAEKSACAVLSWGEGLTLPAPLGG